MMLVEFGTYALCLPAVCWLWHRRRYLATGIAISVILQLIIFAVSVLMWVTVRAGTR